MKTFEEFMEEMKNDAFKAEYMEYIDEKKPHSVDALADMVVEFAENKGFHFTRDDFLKLIPIEPADNTELSDDTLENVSGGSAWEWIQETAYNIVKSWKDSGWL